MSSLYVSTSPSEDNAHSSFEEPSDWARHFFDEPDPDFREVSKKRAMKGLAGAKLPHECDLASALSKHADLRYARNFLIDCKGEGSALLECDASMLSSILPPRVQEWPVWFIRLSKEWQSYIAQMVAVESFHVYGDQHPGDPWYMAQWLSLDAELTEPWRDRKRLSICDDDVGRTLHQSHAVEGVDGVIVFFECDGRLSLTAYPLDDGVFVPLQAGHSSSCRRPLMSNTLAMLQWQVRALEEGTRPETPSLSLSVARLLSRREQEHLAKDRADRARSLKACEEMNQRASQSPAVRQYRMSTSDWVSAVIGTLPTISDCAPVYLEGDDRLWLKVPVVDEFFQEVVSDAPTDVRFQVGGKGDAPDILNAIVIACGPYAVQVAIDWNSLAPADSMRAFLSQQHAWIAVESYRSGYLHFIELQLPSARIANPFDGDAYAAEHRRDVRLFRSQTLDAKSWQQQSEPYPDAESPVGFKVRL